MKINWLIGIILVFFINLFSIALAIENTPQNLSSSQCANYISACDYRIASRKLWSDHVSWTRMYIISALADSKDAQFAANRLLKNQQEIGDSIKPFYGEAAGNKLTDLLKQHILLAVNLINYAKAGNTQLLEIEEKKWYANADEIATFLSTANPNLPKKAVTDMLYKHLQVTKQEVVYRLNKDYANDITAYDEILEDILAMSDAISEAIIKQFPKKFH